MKGLMIILCLATLIFTSSAVLALDSTQETAMNRAISGSSGTLGIKSTSSSAATSYSGVKAVRLGITLVIAGFYFLFVAWLAKSQYVAWAEGGIDSKEGFGSLVSATLLLLLIVFILTV